MAWQLPNPLPIGKRPIIVKDNSVFQKSDKEKARLATMKKNVHQRYIQNYGTTKLSNKHYSYIQRITT